MSKYSYKYRPHYGYTGFLIEFFRGSDELSLKNDFCSAIKEISLKEGKPMDLWMNDEVIYPLKTAKGNLQYTQDIYDNVFILGSEELIKQVNELLETDPLFESLAVNLTEYQLKKK